MNEQNHSDAMLMIRDYGAWNGGTLLDNSAFEKQGMMFKGGIPVNHESIMARIGIRTRMAAKPDERIGSIAMHNLLETSRINPRDIKLIICATNVGEDKMDPGPMVRHIYHSIQKQCPNAIAIDIYAGCPGFNVGVELVFMLSLTGWLKPGDLSLVVGAENIHRARAFVPGDTSNIIFGDDALATSLETVGQGRPSGNYNSKHTSAAWTGEDWSGTIAQAVFGLVGDERIDGIIVDNQLKDVCTRIPALAARTQARLVDLRYPELAQAGDFANFKKALAFYNQSVDSFAIDIMSMADDPQIGSDIARAYVTSGKYRTVVSVHTDRQKGIQVTVHRCEGATLQKPGYGVLDTRTRTHGCFGQFIEIEPVDQEPFGKMDGKGVFLYATRGAKEHLRALMTANQIDLDDLELVIEHQANFAMLPLTVYQLMEGRVADPEQATRDFIANRMVINIQERGNCSVVCMQRLPYDLQRGALRPDNIQGYAINQNLENLQYARLVLHDSVGAGMTRSSFLYRKTS